MLDLRNRQRTQTIDLSLLKSILSQVLVNDLGVDRYELGVHLVAAREMARVNENFLQHQGSTDVITFDHRESPDPQSLHGEIFICVDEAIELAPRFHSTWQAEVLRYAVHGFLHLQGHDDREPTARRTMKRRENRIMRALLNRFAVARIARRMGAPR
jgi:rRNA maturation RNase YbeY